MEQHAQDPRVVMTLDAGGTNFRFSAMRGDRSVVQPVSLPSRGDVLEACLANLVEGFRRVRDACPAPPVAISFAFPGPSDYPLGIIGDLVNLPGFRGGVALGPMLEEQFGVPVFMNNDGDLFAYGEALGGFLPYVNDLLEKAGSPKRYHNLLGITLGTGFGAGIVRDGEVFLGDNCLGAEIWLLRHKLDPISSVEEGASIRGVRRAYAKAARQPLESVPEPRVIFEIGQGRTPGKREAAQKAFEEFGEIVGDALGNALTLLDALVVIGGGLSGAAPLFMPAVMKELNGMFTPPEGLPFRRLTALAYNLDDPEQLRTFLAGGVSEAVVPGSKRKIKYDPLPRVGLGLSRLGTSEATALGAYTFALRRLDARGRGG